MKIIKASRTRSSRLKLDTALSYIELGIYENAIGVLSEEAALNAMAIEYKKLDFLITARFATGQLQAEANKKLNINLENLFVQQPFSNVSETEIKRLNQLVIVKETANCREQSPCDVQPSLQVIDENVIYFVFIYKQFISKFYYFFLFRAKK